VARCGGPDEGATNWTDVSHEFDDSPLPFETELRSKGEPFEPDERMQRILVGAAQLANAQMRVQSLADRRADRAVWDGKHWEWAVLRPENGTFDTPAYADTEARGKWFFQAQIESPAMFARAPGAGSLYWLSARDSSGAYLDRTGLRRDLATA
jgi:hypothetical protein